MIKNKQWWLNFGPLQSACGAFHLFVSSLLWSEETAAAQHYWPQPVSARHTYPGKRKENGEWDRGRQTISALMCFLFQTDVSETANRWLGRCLKPPTPSPPPLFFHGADWSESWVLGRIVTPQAARHCCLHSATSHVSLHATLLTLLSAAKPAREHAGKISLWLKSLKVYVYMYVCMYVQRDQWTHESNAIWLSATPILKSWIGSFQIWLFCPIQACYLFV